MEKHLSTMFVEEEEKNVKRKAGKKRKCKNERMKRIFAN
jgi:hypothetical protein